jgi:hypothetical protein
MTLQRFNALAALYPPQADRLIIIAARHELPIWAEGH